MTDKALKRIAVQVGVGILLFAIGWFGRATATRMSEIELHWLAGHIMDDANFTRVLFARMEQSGKFRPNAADWKVRAGATTPDKTDWEPHEDTDGRWRGLKVTVDTRSGNFKGTPFYFASITSTGAAWGMTSAVYRPDVSSFDFYIMFHDDAETLLQREKLPRAIAKKKEQERALAIAKESRFAVRWIGVEPGAEQPQPVVPPAGPPGR